MSATDGLVARARLWQWAARAFYYPDPDLLGALRDPRRRRELADAAGGSGEAVAAALAAVWVAVDVPCDEVPSLPEEHTFLFARQVPVSPYETSYTPDPGCGRAQTLADLGAFYAAFGFRVSAARPELPDHISGEAEFVAALLAKEAYALAHGWDDHAQVTREAREKFVREHLAPWCSAFVQRLEAHGRLPFYPALGGLVQALLAAEGPAGGAVATGSAVGAGGGDQR